MRSDLRGGEESPACRAGVGRERWERRSRGGCVVDWRACRSFLECGSVIAEINDILVFVLCKIADEEKAYWALWSKYYFIFFLKRFCCLLFCSLVNIFGPLHSFLLELRADRGLR